MAVVVRGIARTSRLTELRIIAATVFGSLLAAYLITHNKSSLAFAAIIGASLMLVVLARPYRGLLAGTALILVVPYQLWLVTPQASIPRIATLLAVGAVIIDTRREPHQLGLTLVDIAVIAFVLIGLFSWQIGPHAPNALRATANFLTPIAFYPVVRRVARRCGDEILWTLLVCSALASLTLYYEFFFSHQPLFQDKASYYWNASDGFIFRPGGVFGSPPAASTILAMTILVSLPLLSKEVGIRRMLARLCAAVSSVGMILTFTRAPLVGFTIGAIAYVVLLRPPSRGRLVFGTAAVGIVAVLFLLPQISGYSWYQKGVLRHGTLSQRQSYWAPALPLISNSHEHLLLGHGINSLVIGTEELPGSPQADIAAVPILRAHGPHSQYIRTLIEEGVVGLVALGAWLLGALLVGAKAAWRAPENHRPILAAATASVLSVVVVGFLGDTLRHPSTLSVVAIVTALVISNSRAPRRFGAGV